MAGQGICKNYGNCYLADKRQLQSFDTSNGICQNEDCGSELTEIIPSSPWKKIGILILLLVFGSGGWCYFNCKFSADKNGNTALLPVGTPIPTPQISTTEKIKIQIQNIQKQINVIQKNKISTSTVISVSTKLQQVQRQMKSIQEQISKLPDGQDTTTLQQQIANEHKRITNIYSQIVKHFNQSLETIKKEVNNSEYSNSLVSKLDTLREQVEAIQVAIGETIGGPIITSLKRQLNELHEQTGRLKAVLSVNKEMPQCLSSASSEMQEKLPMFFVPPAQKRKVPKHLRDWIKGMVNYEINESAFFIMRREVKVSEFQDYVDTLDETKKKQLGMRWRQEIQLDSPDAEPRYLSDDNPVGFVPWWAANGYAQWLTKETGCSLALPTYNQWLAAAISYASPEQAIIEDKHFKKGPEQRMNNESAGELDFLLNSSEKQPMVLDLLGNLREWSRDECNGGHYMLGTDYKTSRANIIGEKICESDPLDTIGFRLILQATH